LLLRAIPYADGGVRLIDDDQFRRGAQETIPAAFTLNIVTLIASSCSYR
jgi:hypothetical protein